MTTSRAVFSSRVPCARASASAPPSPSRHRRGGGGRLPSGSGFLRRIARRRLPALLRAVDADADAWGPWDPPLPPLKHDHPLLSHDVARELLSARDDGLDAMDVSLDFGKSTTAIALLEDGIVVAADADADAEAAHDASSSSRRRRLLLATWDEIAKVSRDEKGVYVLHAGEDVDRFQVFSDDTSRAVSLMPSGDSRAPPTALVAGFSMHRFGVGVNPMEDTMRKINAVTPIRKNARVLDVCTGLAYTAIAAMKKGGRVTTIELDPSMTEMCRMNPHSAELFDGSIQQLYGNAADVLPTLPDGEFDRIVHDPPTFALAGELFSEAFYRELLRVLKPSGKLYHYIGDPASKSAGNVARGVVTRLKQAGFGGAAIDYDAHGVIAARGMVKVSGRGKKPRAQKADAGRKPGGARGRGGGRRGGGRGGSPRGGRRGGGQFSSDDDDDDDDRYY